MDYFISDTHFGHANILKFDNRPFIDIIEHDKVILSNINETVSQDDTIWHLGDVAWSPQAYRQFMAGLRKDISIYFLRGNHDHRWQPGKEIGWQTKFLPKGNGWFLSHYPHWAWPNSCHGSIHLYGHVHGMGLPVGRSMDVSCNMIDYRPISMDQVVAKLRETKPHGV